MRNELLLIKTNKMRNKIFGRIAVLVVALIAFLNVNIGLNTNKKADITLTNVEALAGWESWWGQPEDEMSVQEECPIMIEGQIYQTTYIRCVNGYEKCTPVDCYFY